VKNDHCPNCRLNLNEYFDKEALQQQHPLQQKPQSLVATQTTCQASAAPLVHHEAQKYSHVLNADNCLEEELHQQKYSMQQS
jgi:hypothetical protein